MTTSRAGPPKIGYGVSLDAGVVAEEMVRQLRQLPHFDKLERRLASAMVRLWAARLPKAGLHHPSSPSTPRSPAFSDNVQRTMNLIMPLSDPSAAGRAKVLKLFITDGELILTALRNVGTVHSARFDFLGNNLCLFSVYDGDGAAYVRDFIVCAGAFFNHLMEHVTKPAPTPVEHHVDEFIEWVAIRDLVQLPEDLTEVCPDFQYLERCAAVLLHDCPELQVFSYSQYPSYTAAQIREGLQIGW
jgi:hypothetical protein